MQDRRLAQRDFDVSEHVPVRGNNRLESLRIAVAPLRDVMRTSALERLTRALMFMCGVEALVVARDALDLDEKAAADVMCWSARSLVRVAIDQSVERGLRVALTGGRRPRDYRKGLTPKRSIDLRGSCLRN